MRTLHHAPSLTPMGIWIREKCRDSHDGLCVTNLDYVIEDYKNRRLMLIEEKANGATLSVGQAKTFSRLHPMIMRDCRSSDYDYWGFFLLQFPHGQFEPCDGMTLNGHPITTEQLIEHINFTRKHCESANPIALCPRRIY